MSPVGHFGWQTVNNHPQNGIHTIYTYRHTYIHKQKYTVSANVTEASEEAAGV